MHLKNKVSMYQEQSTFCEKKESESLKNEQKLVIFFFLERLKNERSHMLVLLLGTKVESPSSFMRPLPKGLLFLLYAIAIGIRPMRKQGG